MRTQEELKQTKEKLELLSKEHDSEVKELFENKYTLKFVKQMRHYKQEWAEKTGDEDRKKIATQMASSTKNWVAQTEDSTE